MTERQAVTVVSSVCPACQGHGLTDIGASARQILSFDAKRRTLYGEPLRERIAAVIVRETVGEVAPYGDPMTTYLRAADAVIEEIVRNQSRPSVMTPPASD